MDKDGPAKAKGYHITLLTLVAAVFLWSAVNPLDYVIWSLEVFPAVLGAVILISTYKRFRFTDAAYTLVALHAIILLVGGHYTYSEVPLFERLSEAFGLSRNPFDRVGHFFQGFTPAIVAREILIRTSPLKKGGWLFFIVVAICLSISAFYELLEWWVALLSGEPGSAFIGAQGDIWDAQWDMFLALIGSIISQLSLGPLHDRQLEKTAG